MESIRGFFDRGSNVLNRFLGPSDSSKLARQLERTPRPFPVLKINPEVRVVSSVMLVR